MSTTHHPGIHSIQLPREAESFLVSVSKIENPKDRLAACRNFSMIVQEAECQVHDKEHVPVLAVMDTKPGKPKDVYFQRPFRSSRLFRKPHTTIMEVSDAECISGLRSALIRYSALFDQVATREFVQLLSDILFWLRNSRGSIKIPIRDGKIVLSGIKVKEFVI